MSLSRCHSDHPCAGSLAGESRTKSARRSYWPEASREYKSRAATIASAWASSMVSRYLRVILVPLRTAFSTSRSGALWNRTRHRRQQGQEDPESTSSATAHPAGPEGQPTLPLWHGPARVRSGKEKADEGWATFVRRPELTYPALVCKISSPQGGPSGWLRPGRRLPPRGSG